MAKFSTETLDALRSATESAVSDSNTGLPGTTVVVVSKDGEVFAHAAGKRGVGSHEDMTLDSVYWIASCTKMIVGIACMQLVEQGKLKLDDVELVEKLAPELKSVKVLEEGGKLVEKKRGITLRMLLTHTAGFGYSFFNERLRDFGRPIGFAELPGSEWDILAQPLVNQPGDRFEYGINIDWAGVLIQRVTGLTLNGYLTKNIFEPLGLKQISMLPTEQMKSNLVYMNHRKPDGTLVAEDHFYRAPLLAKSDTEFFNSGGAGCFAKPQEYGQIIATLLNDGVSPTTKNRILQVSTVDEMFTNQIPDMPNFARQSIPAAKPFYTNPISELYPAGDKPQGWGLTFMITPGGTGRSDKTAHWAGLPNLWWWADREKGVGGIICNQIVPFGDLQTLGLWVAIESTVYKAL